MSRAVLLLHTQRDREKAFAWVAKAPEGTRLTFQEAKRSTAQNDALWAALTDIAGQCQHHGQKLSADDWKTLFMDALNREARMVPNLDNKGFVNLGRSSSDLSKAEFGDLLTIIHEWGARNGVQFHNPAEKAA
jgi:hypothetical protein